MKRPLISFPVLAYNQERFVRDAVEGAFSQTYAPLEIVLSDDHSSDRTFEFMQEKACSYNGPHCVLLNRNEKNLGIGGHINRIMELCHGELIVPSAGDDISLPERTGEVLEAWESSNRKPLYLLSNVTVIDELGRKIGLLLPRGSHPDFSLRQLVEKRRNVWC